MQYLNIIFRQKIFFLKKQQGRSNSDEIFFEIEVAVCSYESLCTEMFCFSVFLNYLIYSVLNSVELLKIGLLLNLFKFFNNGSNLFTEFQSNNSDFFFSFLYPTIYFFGNLLRIAFLSQLEYFLHLLYFRNSCFWSFSFLFNKTLWDEELLTA